MCGGKCYYKLGQLSYYNMGQTLLQIGADLQIRATVITNWGMTRTLNELHLLINSVKNERLHLYFIFTKDFKAFYGSSRMP